MRKLLCFVISSILISCSKEPSTMNSIPPVQIDGGNPKLPPNDPQDTAGTTGNGKAILIDASRDGGVWWFSSGNIYQGYYLTAYLQSLGYTVHQLTRGTIITPQLLNSYRYVIRASAFGQYSPSELEAYQSFLSRPVSLLLLQDHMSNNSNDNLSASLGLNFEGIKTGTLTTFNTSHPVVQNVFSVPYIAGSVVRNYDPNKVIEVATLDGSLVMGEVKHDNAKIFFIGDTNGIEQVPQPFTYNLVNWLFR